MTNRDECDSGSGVLYGNVLVLFIGKDKVVPELNERSHHEGVVGHLHAILT
jgi:hypothetical protein